ncbi:squalene/phytoene synthase family protein [bacterium]|nr:squalene/phytoene synthase family protein [bacterium]MDB4381070.1 squalene/phytoene synthase family protein [Mariniblastus sp.]MDB4385950.1 squalene/phytoene synthase family protein [bacterium]MDC3225042.1 squalene/phytoene synthase family protein [Mariniblastus sp.]
MLTSPNHIQLNSNAIERGYRSCRGAGRRYFKSQIWTSVNLPRDQRRALDAVLFNLMRTLDLLDLESADGRSLDVWFEVRDDLSDAFRGQCTSVELAALVDASRRFKIPKQFIFDPLRGADLWIRNQKFETFGELESFCSYVGGSSLVSAMPILGVIKPDFEVSAIECGKAIMLTQLLANCVNDMKRNKTYLAQDDMSQCELDIPRLKLRRTSPSLVHFVRLYASRIEKMFFRAKHLAEYLDFDGKRTLKSLLAIHWQMLLKMQLTPETILSELGVLNRQERLALQSRHLLGLERDIPIFIDSKVNHTH